MDMYNKSCEKRDFYIITMILGFLGGGGAALFIYHSKDQFGTINTVMREIYSYLENTEFIL